MRLVAIIAVCCLLTPVSGQVPDAASHHAQIRQATLDALEARMPGARDRLEVSVVRATGLGAETDAALSIQLPSEPLLPRGRIQIPVSTADGASAWAVVQIAHFDSVATLPASLSRGDTVDRDQLRFVWMDVTRFSGDPLTPSTLSGWKSSSLIASRSLASDRPLRASDVGPRPAAEAGDPIRMTYTRSGFVLEITCRARDRGLVGDVIRLYADDSNTMYRGRLLGNGRAEWLETL